MKKPGLVIILILGLILMSACSKIGCTDSFSTRGAENRISMPYKIGKIRI